MTFVIYIYSSKISNLIDYLILKDYNSIYKRSLFYYVRKQKSYEEINVYFNKSYFRFYYRNKRANIIKY